MKKLVLIVLVAILGALNANAQEVDSLSSEQMTIVDSLSNELAELQHKYNYLDLINQIEHATLEAQMFCNEMLINVNSTKITIYHQGFDLDLYLSMENDYKLCERSFNLLKIKADNAKSLATMRKLFSDFSDTEIDCIDSACGVLDAALSKAEKSLEYHRGILDIYKKLG